MRGSETGAAARDRGAMLFLAGLAALAAGALVYMLERPADSVLFLPAALSLYDGGAWLPPALGGALPSFLHTMAFALMTAALLPAMVRARLAACAVWASIDILFEAAQHPLLVATVGTGMPGIFDPLDMAAALAGGTAAFVASRKICSGERSPA